MNLGIVITDKSNRFAPIPLKGDLISCIKKANSFGYKGVEISVKDPEEIDAGKIKEIIEDLNMEVIALGTGQIYLEEGLSFSDADSEIRKKAVKNMKRFVDFSKYFNSPVILGLIIGQIKDHFENINIKEYHERINECILECLDYSNKYSTNFLLEPINRYETNIFNKVEDITNFIEGYFVEKNRERVGVLIDTFHMNIEEKDIYESIESNMKYIKHVHFADSNRWPPGFGHLDFKTITKSLENIKYDKYISFEMLPFPDEENSAIIAIENIKKVLTPNK